MRLLVLGAKNAFLTLKKTVNLPRRPLDKHKETLNNKRRCPQGALSAFGGVCDETVGLLTARCEETIHSFAVILSYKTRRPRFVVKNTVGCQDRLGTSVR